MTTSSAAWFQLSDLEEGGGNATPLAEESNHDQGMILDCRGRPQ